MAHWLKTGAIVDDIDLIEQLTAPEYGYNVRNELQLEPKSQMYKRGFSSPDMAALALTFAILDKNHKIIDYNFLLQTKYKINVTRVKWLKLLIRAG